MSDEELQRIQGLDPLSMAEKVTGQSYKENSETSALGFLLAMGRGKMLEQELKSRGDTYRSCPYSLALEILEADGFQRILDVPFDSPNWGKPDPSKQTMFLLWHNDGILAKVETYYENLNSCDICYNIILKEGYD
ncbi:hypothetical protein V4W88_09990, partial [Pediococcus acidilactici]|uniref:hypothetical protein n=1 Tax=Pediococcus acidilactici TaxID=1254 RepID=UPI002FBE03E2